MTQRLVNPWTWQEHYGFAQAVEVTGAARVLYCAGQVAVDDEGHPMHAGDMGAQLAKALDNLETVLRAAGLDLSRVVRLNYYTTDVPAFLEAAPQLQGRLGRAGCRPASTLLGVASLFHPDALVEIEATAVA